MKSKLSKITGALLLSFAVIAFVPTMASAHCDTMDGPLISDAKKAIEMNDSNYILKWVLPEDEQGILETFELTMKVRGQSADAQELADHYFFENLVRIHRAGEGAPFTGVQPEGAPMEEAIVAADKSIEVENLDAFEGLISEEKMPELQEKFDRILATKDFEVNDVDAGREYIEAYVQFTHFAEGGEHGEGDAHAAEGDAHAATESEHTEAEVATKVLSEEIENPDTSLTWLPWSLAGLFFLTTLIAFFRKHKHS